MLQLTQVNEQLKSRVKQLTQALETSLLQRQQSHQVLLQQQTDMDRNVKMNSDLQKEIDDNAKQLQTMEQQIK